MRAYMNKILSDILDGMIKFFPAWCFGKSTVIKDKCRNNYSQRDWDSLVYRIRIRNVRSYLILTIIFIISVLIVIIGSNVDKAIVEQLKRPEYGQAEQKEVLRAKANYEGDIIERVISIRVPSKELTDDEKREVLLAYRKSLPSQILGGNSDLNEVTTDLDLPEGDSKANIKVEWLSDSEILNNRGELDTLMAKEGGNVILTAIISLDQLVEEVHIPITILPFDTNEHSRAIENRLYKVAEEMEEKLEVEDDVVLPESLDEKITVEWSRQRESVLPVIICLFLFGYLILFFKRYEGIEREIKRRKEAIVDDFPDFIDKLILLLNAGLVTDVALRKVTMDHQRFKEKRPLYEGLMEMQKRIDETNAPLTKELREFAQKSCVRELIRFATIIEDNINKGSTLAEKLEGEGNLLWLGKKKRAEEKGRLAETKLTFPLLLLLIALLLITTAPVLFDL